MLGRVNQSSLASQARRDAAELSELLKAEELSAAETVARRKQIALNEIEISDNLAKNQAQLDAAGAAGVEKGLFLAYCVLRKERMQAEADRMENDKARLEGKLADAQKEAELRLSGICSVLRRIGVAI